MIYETVIILKAGRVKLRCGCDRMFQTNWAHIRQAAMVNKDVRCSNCQYQSKLTGRPSGKPKDFPDQPKTFAAREAVQLLKDLGHDPSHTEMRSIAKAIGITPQSLEKLWYRWIVLPERNELRRQAQQKELQ